jgi:uncharacterized protein
MTTQNKKETVLIIGASNKPDRYSYKALKMLQEYGYEIIAVHPTLKKIEEIEVVSSLVSVGSKKKIDTVTLYVNPELLKKYQEDLIKLKPTRVIFNPGTEAADIEADFEKHGIKTVRGCTLVMLRTGQF